MTKRKLKVGDVVRLPNSRQRLAEWWVMASDNGYDLVGVTLDDDKLGFIASDELNPQKARILLSLALLKNVPKEQLQAMYRTY